MFGGHGAVAGNCRDFDEFRPAIADAKGRDISHLTVATALGDKGWGSKVWSVLLDNLASRRRASTSWSVEYLLRLRKSQSEPDAKVAREMAPAHGQHPRNVRGPIEKKDKIGGLPSNIEDQDSMLSFILARDDKTGR